MNKSILYECAACSGESFLTNSPAVYATSSKEVDLSDQENKSSPQIKSQCTNFHHDSKEVTDDPKILDVIHSCLDKNTTVQSCRTTSVNIDTQKSLHCALCTKTFLHRCSLIAHLQKHDKLTCRICDRTFKSLTHLRTHKKRHVRCLLYTSPSPRDRTRSRMPSSA